MNEQVTLEEFDNHIEKLKEQVKITDALKRLQKNSDFELIINNQYLREEAIRLVELRSDPEMQTPERQQTVENGIIAVGNLRQFFIRIFRMGAMAERDISEAQTERQAFIEESQE